MKSYNRNISSSFYELVIFTLLLQCICISCRSGSSKTIDSPSSSERLIVTENKNEEVRGEAHSNKNEATAKLDYREELPTAVFGELVKRYDELLRHRNKDTFRNFSSLVQWPLSVQVAIDIEPNTFFGIEILADVEEFLKFGLANECPLFQAEKQFTPSMATKMISLEATKKHVMLVHDECEYSDYTFLFVEYEKTFRLSRVLYDNKLSISSRELESLLNSPPFQKQIDTNLMENIVFLKENCEEKVVEKFDGLAKLCAKISLREDVFEGEDECALVLGWLPPGRKYPTQLIGKETTAQCFGSVLIPYDFSKLQKETDNSVGYWHFVVMDGIDGSLLGYVPFRR